MAKASPRLRTGRLALLLAGTAALGPSLLSVAAVAQTLLPDNVLTVQQRSTLDTSPTGVRLGSFIVDPGIEVDSTFDDNIFRTPSGKKADLITDVKPAIAIQSDWEKHAIFFGAEGDSGLFATHSGQNYFDYGVLLSGRYDLAYQTYFTGAVSRAKRHIALGSVDDPNSGQPATYVFTTEQLGFTRALGLVHLDLQAKNEDVSLSSIGGAGDIGVEGENDFHDRNDKSLLTTLSYETMPGNSLFVSSAVDRNDYTTLAGGGSHASHGTNSRAGIQITTKRNFSASVYEGYLQRNYDGGSPTDDPYTGVNIYWDATPRTTFTLTLDEAFNQATVTDAAGVIQHRHRVTARHSLTERLSADASLGYNNNDYVGGTSSVRRATKIYYGGVGTDYRVTDDIGVRGAYDYQKRLSPLASDQYNDNRVTVSLVWME